MDITTTPQSLEEYQTLYDQSVQDPETFWAAVANHYISWHQPWQTVRNGSFAQANVAWFSGGKLNACYNCLDRHLPQHANRTAIIWEGDDPSQSQHISYQALYESVCRFANVLIDLGIKKGDRVCIYLPMIPEVAIAMLACARIGAIHSVVFGGFSPIALKNRILDADCSLVITADAGIRGNQIVPLKSNTDTALLDCSSVRHVITVKYANISVNWQPHRDIWYHEAIQNTTAECDAIPMQATDPLFILYTSGSTGKPKGVLHTTGGYLVYAALTHKMLFNCQPNDVYWCTADTGWVTGHSYIIYGPLCNAATTLIFAGTPNYPTPSRYWEVVDKHQVSVFYTAPTAIRALMRAGDHWVQQTSRRSLRLLGTVGEPINPKAWEWYHQTVGAGRCPIVDTWWQTETGGILISPFPNITPTKPGAACWPFFGIVPTIVDDAGQPLEGTQQGNLVISQPWPGMMNTLYGDHQRFIDTYFKPFPGFFFTGDGAKCDEAGDYWIIGRIDDVINVSGHRFGTAEIESAIVAHSQIAEAAIVGTPHDIKGQSIYAFVTPKENIEPTPALKEAVITQVRNSIGAIAIPDTIQWAQALPKTRSGKIMRRILRKIANGDVRDLGDTSTLAEPEVVNQLITGRMKL